MSETSVTPLSYAVRPSRRRQMLPALLAAAVVAALLLTSAARSVLRTLRHPGRAVSTTIQVMDADTGAPLQMTISGPPIGTTNPWSTTYTSAGMSKMRLAWRDVDDLPITVGSAGYLSTRVTLNGRTPAVVVVPLKKPR
jgi:hypothetical protein